MAQPNPVPFLPEQQVSPAIVSEDASLIRGGPFYRAQQTTRLIDSTHWNLGRRIILSIAVG